MKITLLILSLLFTFLANIGCATVEEQPNYLQSIFKPNNEKTYNAPQICRTIQQGNDWYGNPIYKTECQ